ncbi:nucleoside/nucleotide kinase family protein [Microbacterium lacticum]
MSETVATMSVDELVERAGALAGRGGRAVLGITGAPGAGKSTLAELIVERLGPKVATFVPMDGFHFANDYLDATGLRARKGSPDTFDAWGYLSLIERIRRQPEASRRGEDGVIFAPRYLRELEESIGSHTPVTPDVPLIVTEGNYLLLDEGPWPRVRELLDESWFLAPSETVRIDRLVARHVRFGRSPEQARERSLGNDQRNAELIAATASRADLVVQLV